MKRRKLVYLLATVCLVAGSISGCMQLQPTNPQAMFTASEDQLVIPFTASFDATLSVSPNGEVTSYVWNFGDGGSDTGPVVDHIYAQDGDYDVVLTIFDAEGRTSTASMRIQAMNPLPIADFTYSPKSNLEEEIVISASEWVTFDASASTDDEDVVSYHWYFGRESDGDIMEADGPVVTCRFLYAGSHSIVLTVTDNDGDSTSCTQQVTVIGGAPCYPDTTGDYPWTCQ